MSDDKTSAASAEERTADVDWSVLMFSLATGKIKLIRDFGPEVSVEYRDHIINGLRELSAPSSGAVRFDYREQAWDTRDEIIEQCAQLVEMQGRKSPSIDGQSFYLAIGQATAAIRALKGKPSAAPAARLAIEGNCPQCEGSGESKGMTQGHGPDDYEVDIPCPNCKGTGTIPENPDLTAQEIEELQPAVIKLLKEIGREYPCHDQSEFLNQVDCLFSMARRGVSATPEKTLLTLLERFADNASVEDVREMLRAELP